MKDLLVIVPSRNRPKNIERLLDHMEANNRGDTTLLVGLDADDPELKNYPTYPTPYVVEPDLHQVVPWINRLAMPEVDNYRFIGTIGDDNTVDTPGWDVRIIASLDAHHFAFGNDLYPREPGSLCCHVFTRSEVIKALGYLGPPEIRHMWVDPIWMLWGRSTSIEFLEDVIIKHRHYSIGEAEVDANYQASASWTGNDLIAFNAYVEGPQLAEDIGKMGGKMVDLKQFRHDLNIPPDNCGAYPCTKPLAEH